MKTKALIWSGVLALLALLTISALSTDANGDAESVTQTTDAAEDCPMHQQSSALSDGIGGGRETSEVVSLLEACENEVDSALSSGTVDEMAKRLTQFRHRLTLTKQSLLRPTATSGCCGTDNADMMSGHDDGVETHEGCATNNDMNAASN